MRKGCITPSLPFRTFWDRCLGSKASHFSETFEALGPGIEVDLSESNSGRVFLKKKRVLEVCETLDSVMNKGSLPRSLAMRLRRRMQFADSQIFGRTSKLCLRAVTFRSALCNDRPCVLNAWPANPTFCFTDACYEPSSRSWVHGIGGILDDSSGHLKAAFSTPLAESHRLVLAEGQSKTIIVDCELIALLVAMHVWSTALSHQPVLCFVDQKATQDICISAHSLSPRTEALLSVLLDMDESLQLQAWYARVLSPPNVADEPSSKLLKHVCLDGNMVTTTKVDASLEAIVERVSNKLGLNA